MSSLGIEKASRKVVGRPKSLLIWERFVVLKQSLANPAFPSFYPQFRVLGLDGNKRGAFETWNEMMLPELRYARFPTVRIDGSHHNFYEPFNSQQ